MPPAEGTIGAFPGIDIEDYHGGVGVSKSALDDFRKSPLLYWANRNDPTKPPEEEKASHLQGNLLHCAFLEPDHFGARYVTVPEDSPKKPSITQRNAVKPSPDTIKAIDWWDKFMADNADKKIITPDAYTLAWKQADSLRKVKTLADLTAKGQPEVSAYWIDPITGLYCRCRPDWDHPVGSSGDVLLDVKGAVDARAEVFARVQAFRMRYHVQDAFYTEGWAAATGRQVHGFLFGVVEDTWPFLADVIEFDDPSKAQGRKDFREDLNGIKRHVDTGVWRDPGESVKTMSIPPYGFTED